MGSLSFTHFLSLPRFQSNQTSSNTLFLSPKFSGLEGFTSKYRRKWFVEARKKNVEGLSQESPLENEVVVEKKKKKKTVSTTKRTRKKAVAESSDLETNSDSESLVSDSGKEAKKTPGRPRKRAVSASSTSSEEAKPEKKVRGRRKKTTQKEDTDIKLNEIDETKEASDEKKVQQRTNPIEDLAIESESELSEAEETIIEEEIIEEEEEEEEEEDLKIDEDGEDISHTYGWPPLVCCFGAAQHAFVPSGRPANRLVDHEIHERMKEAYWSPEKFVRSPGGCAGSVAIALASLGGKVAFMGKLGKDDYGEAMLYYLNFNGVQTRSVKIDAKRATAVSRMKISRRGRFRAICVKTCSEDSMSKAEINVDVLKEAKMFYFNTHTLLDPYMRSTTLRAIKISKKLGADIFYDVNLPMPLWHSSEEAKSFVQQALNLADIIEVTKQELEFLCGITPMEEFDTKNNDVSKFVRYEPEVVAPIRHENLKVLFVTNGTSEIHYYTAEHSGAMKGMEDAPLTPSTCDMSASGDGIIAGILRMLTVQPHLITDKGYLEHTIKYAINCGVIDQWALGRVQGFPPTEDSVVEATPDENGIRSLTEREFRTINTVGSNPFEFETSY